MIKLSKLGEEMLDLAENEACSSNCIRSKFGCVLVCEGGIRSFGKNVAYNDCSEIGCYRDKNKIPTGKEYEKCRAIHSEEQAIASAARLGISTYEADLYLVKIVRVEISGEDKFVRDICEPCKWCKKIIIESGIKTVITPYQIFDVNKWRNNFDKYLDKEGY